MADQIVQAGHACLEAGRCFQPEDGCHLVVLGVPNTAELELAVQRAEAIGIRCARFYEPVDGLGFTAACTAPIGDQARRLFRRYSLWSAPRPRGPPLSSKFLTACRHDALTRCPLPYLLPADGGGD